MPDLAAVADLVRRVAAEIVTPRFRALTAGDVSEKSPGELVTVVDREAEAALTDGLRALTPDAAIVGEEAACADPTLLGALAGGGLVWLVDPLDGTAGFASGSVDHAVMVALVDAGSTVAAVIYQPQHDRTYVAELGSGAYENGVRLVRSPPASDLAELRGGVMRRFLDAETSAAIERNAHRFADLTPGSGCAGVEYPLIATGRRDFLLFWRTLPWDHAAGALIVGEAGGVARRLDGSIYRPGVSGVGLLVAADAATWDNVSSGLGVGRVHPA